MNVRISCTRRDFTCTLLHMPMPLLDCPCCRLFHQCPAAAGMREARKQSTGLIHGRALRLLQECTRQYDALESRDSTNWRVWAILAAATAAKAVPSRPSLSSTISTKPQSYYAKSYNNVFSCITPGSCSRRGPGDRRARVRFKRTVPPLAPKLTCIAA